MTEIVIPDELASILERLTEPVILRTESGWPRGTFTPEPLVPWEPSITREELDRRVAEGGGQSLANILQKLENDGRLRHPPVDDAVMVAADGAPARRRLDKDPTVLAVLDRLAARLGPTAFDVVDHWDCDLTAVGVARPDDHRVLAYISTFNMPAERYVVELELPRDEAGGVPYTVARSRSAVDFGELVEMVRAHLAHAV